MPRQLNIRSDEAHRLAHLIADQTGRPVVDVVVEALRDYGSKLPPVDDMTPTQRAGYEAYNMTGGLLEWDAQGLPLEPDGGSVADH